MKPGDYVVHADSRLAADDVVGTVVRLDKEDARYVWVNWYPDELPLPELIAHLRVVSS